MTSRIGRRGVGAFVGLLCGLLALGPALGPGFLLRYDLVYVPRLALGERTMGVDGSVPRAVPNDFVVAVLSHVLPGWIVEKALLLAVFVLVGAGVAALSRSRLGATAAALVAAWNPYVAERLSIGHWGYLLGYACVPFLAHAAGELRSGRPRARTRLGGWLLVSAATGSTGAVLGMICVLAVLAMPTGDVRRAGRRLREFGWAIGIFVLANATWWFAYLFLAPSTSTSRVGVEAFMSRADTPWGVLGSLLSGGGIWNEGVWLPGRDSLVASGAALLVVLAVVALGLRDRTWRDGPAAAGLWAAGVIGLVLAAASALPVGRTLMTALVIDVPGGGLLRDAQKFVGLWVLLVAVLSGHLVERIRAIGVSVGAERVVAVGVAAAVGLWPVVTLTGLAWGASGQWRAVSYPSSYEAMARRIDALPAGGVAVFPWNLYRQYAFDHEVVLLDPWQRLLDRDVLVNDSLPLTGGVVVPGEDPHAAQVTAALKAGASPMPALRAAGVRYLLVQTDQPAGAGMPKLTGVQSISADGTLRLYDLGAAGVRARSDDSLWRFTGWALAGLAVLLVAGDAIRGRRVSRPRRLRGPGRS